MAGTCNNVVLLFLCKVDEAYCIARNANREVCIFGLFRMSLAVLELFYAEYVYVQVVCATIEVSVHYVHEIVDSLFLIVSECVGVDCLSVGNSVE